MPVAAQDLSREDRSVERQVAGDREPDLMPILRVRLCPFKFFRM